MACVWLGVGGGRRLSQWLLGACGTHVPPAARPSHAAIHRPGSLSHSGRCGWTGALRRRRGGGVVAPSRWTPLPSSPCLATHPPRRARGVRRQAVFVPPLLYRPISALGHRPTNQPTKPPKNQPLLGPTHHHQPHPSPPSTHPTRPARAGGPPPAAQPLAGHHGHGHARDGHPAAAPPRAPPAPAALPPTRWAAAAPAAGHALGRGPAPAAAPPPRYAVGVGRDWVG